MLKQPDMKIIKRTLLSVIVLCFLGASAMAQTDYTAQVNALKKSFAEKKPDAIKPYVSDKLAFASYPAGASLQILGQVFMSLPALNSLEILSQKKGEAEVRYDFTALGKRTSKILFDETGKLTKLFLVDNLLKEQAAAQAAAAAQKQGPTPGELSKKYLAQKVEITAKDGLLVTGALYEIDESKPVILLCHQAGYNKYEYADIAPKLNEMGFNVMAIDQRSGGTFASKDNETFNLAKSKGLPTEFLDAQQDMEAAIDYLSKKFDQKVILWGSSYSSSLTLFIAEKNKKVSAAISFSPGDYFGEAKTSLANVFPKLKIPFLVTSSKQEAEALSGLLEGVKLTKDQSQFIPEGAGYHGSRALWEGQQGGEEYWTALTAFLSDLKTK